MIPLMDFQCSADQQIELNHRTHKSASGQCEISVREQEKERGSRERERREAGEQGNARSRQKQLASGGLENRPQLQGNGFNANTDRHETRHRSSV